MFLVFGARLEMRCLANIVNDRRWAGLPRLLYPLFVKAMWIIHAVSTGLVSTDGGDEDQWRGYFNDENQD